MIQKYFHRNYPPYLIYHLQFNAPEIMVSQSIIQVYINRCPICLEKAHHNWEDSLD